MLTVEQHAQRAADQHDGHRHGPARALRHRGQPLEPVAHREDVPVQQIEQLVRMSREFGRESPAARKRARSARSAWPLRVPGNPSAAHFGISEVAMTTLSTSPWLTAKAGRAYAWLVFALTFGLLVSDYMSRQVLSAVFPLLKAEWA
jgi:hypothetical protein